MMTTQSKNTKLSRRGFLYAGAAVGAAAPLAHGASRGPIALITHPADKTAASAPVQHAVKALEAALVAAGFAVAHHAKVEASAKNAFAIVLDGRDAARGVAESFTIAGATLAGRRALQVTGADARGLMYGLRELTVRLRSDPATALSFATPLKSAPFNPVRSVMRQFTSKAYDTDWFHDRAMWPVYLSMLAENRFNRLHLCFGLAYDALVHVADSYFLFTYPFLVDVPAYKVRVSGLPDAERARNLETLKFISEQTVAHGLDFELGLWMHGYDWPAAPGVPTIEGLNPDNHAAYCRDALTLLLKSLPAVSSVSLRFHGESGIKEGSYEFWKTVFAGIPAAGRRIEIDLHAKGVDTKMIDNALATGMPVNVAPKYWAEHLGVPYHQAAIREFDMPKPGQVGKGLMTLSEGSRSFTRYGFADLLRDGRRYTIRHRVFPGTQHVLAWGDPEWAARYGQMFAFCGSRGADLMEPLTYRGRRGSAVAGGDRSGYAATKLRANWDWQKYGDWYRTLGRGLYDPTEAASPTDSLHKALALASRILPIITTSYMPSAACDAYWPEVYWNQPMAGEPTPNPYGDLFAPKVFQNSGPLDPQLFSSMREFAGELKGEASGKCSPVQVATWLEQLAAEIDAKLAEVGAPSSVEAVCLATDIRILAGLGRFFAAKFRAGVLFALFEQNGDKRAVDAALAKYRQARQAWADIVATADGVYGDLGSSDILTEHGAWVDKLPLIDADIAAVEKLAAAAKPVADPKLAEAIAAAEAVVAILPGLARHLPPANYAPGQNLSLDFATDAPADSAVLWYRQVNQAQIWQSLAMTKTPAGWQGTIPAAATAAPYALQYYAVFRTAAGRAVMYPGLSIAFTALPYIVVERQS